MAEACAACPWSRELPAYLPELMRLHNLLRLGVSIPIDRLDRWQQDALLVVDDELRERTKPPPG